tara:strand:- start:678 stop:1673 length:996 start_codon:yes stop_codon:yes gene_type:complete
MIKEFQDIRTGVIGVGSMGQNHARIYSEVSNLVAVSDSDVETGEKIAKRFGVEYYQDYRDLVEKVDAVSLAVPTSYHKNMAVKIASMGKHILVEKPLADDFLGAEEIVKASEKSNIILAVGHIERHNEVVKYAKKCIAEGLWGNILTISARRFSSFPERIHDVGVLFDLTIHDVDVISYLIDDKVCEVFALGGKAKNNIHEDHVVLSMKFENGLIGLCETNWLTPMKVRDISITTDTCFVTIDYIKQEIKVLSTEYKNFDPANLFKAGLEVSEDKKSFDKIEPLRNEIVDFLSAVKENRKPLVTGDQGINAIKIVQAGLESIYSGEPVKLK